MKHFHCTFLFERCNIPRGFLFQFRRTSAGITRYPLTIRGAYNQFTCNLPFMQAQRNRTTKQSENTYCIQKGNLTFHRPNSCTRGANCEKFITLLNLHKKTKKFSLYQAVLSPALTFFWLVTQPSPTRLQVVSSSGIVERANQASALELCHPRGR